VAIPVDEDGWYRVSFEEIVAMGLDPDASTLHIHSNGVEQPYKSEYAGPLNPGEALFFWGQKNRGEADMPLYKNVADRPNREISLFSDQRFYYFYNDATFPPYHYAISTTSPVINTDNYEHSFSHTTYKEPHNAFYNGVPFKIGDINNWYAEMDAGEGFTGGLILAGQERTEWMPTPHIDYAQGGYASIEGKIAGNYNDIYLYNDHFLEIKINDVFCYSLNFEGFSTKNFHFEIPLSRLADSTAITVQTITSNAQNDQNSIVYLQISYPRKRMTSTNAFTRYEGISNDIQYWRINRKDENAIMPLILDPDNAMIIEGYTHPYGYFYTIPTASTNTSRTLVQYDDSQYLEINTALAEPIHFTDYSAPAQQGNFIIITHPSLIGEVTDAYKEYRSSAAGGGYTVVVADIEELYHQFAWGVDKSPLAIRHFINFALDQWDSPPEFLLLAGKSIDYNSIRFNAVLSQLCLVPTFGSPPCDLLLTARDPFLSTPQIPIGRIPAKNPAELQNYLNKVISHESLNADPCNASHLAWTKRTLQLVSGYNSSEANTFLNYLQGYLPYFVQSSFAGEVLATLTQSVNGNVPQPDLPGYLNNGVGLITYMGHPTTSGTVYWNFDIDAPEAYENAGKYPLINANSCFSGNIHSYGLPVMAEDYTLAAERGSIGYVAIVNFGFPAFMDPFNEAFYERLLNTEYGQPIGQALHNAVQSIYAGGQGNFSEGLKKTCQSLVYAGDPAVKMVSFDKPDFQPEMGTMSLFTPPSLPGIVEHQLQLTILNNGSGTNDSLKITVVHTPPSETATTLISKNYFVAGARSNFTIPFDLFLEEGPHQFLVILDDENSIDENCELNNSFTFEHHEIVNNCPDIGLDILNLPTNICPNGGILELEANYLGGIFSIDGEVVDNLNSASWNLGHHTLKYEYTEGECTYLAAASFEIVALPVINFIRPDKICFTDTASVVYTGTVVPGITLEWTFPPGVNASGNTGPGPHTLTFDAAANYQITLAVSNTSCSVNPVTKNILAEPHPGPATISCMEATGTSISISVETAEPVFVYGVIVNGQPAINGIVNNGVYLLNNLNPGFIYEIQMFGKGNSVAGTSCGNGDTSNLIICQTLSCANLLPSIEGLPSDHICMYGGTFTLSSDLPGGEFSGDGISENQFDPLQAALGSHLITYNYTDSLTQCSYQSMQLIEVFLEPQVWIEGDPYICEDGLIMLTATPGLDHYNWSDGGEDSPYHLISEPGSYTVTATDRSGCIVTDEITILSTDLMAENNGFVLDTLHLQHHASLWLSTDNVASGYSWSIGETADSIYVDTQGSYSVLITDQNGCTEMDAIYIEIDECSDFSMTAYGENTSCGIEDGVITIFGSGGTPPYMYYVDSVQTGNEILQLAGGEYYIQLLDSLGCSVDTTILIQGLFFPDIELGPDTLYSPINIWNLSVPNVYASVLWSTGQTDTLIQITESGYYSVEVSNEEGCTNTDSIYVILTPQVNVLPSISTQDCARVIARMGTVPIISADEEMYIQLFSASGEKIYQDSGKTTYTLTNIPIPRGVYIAKMVFTDQRICLLKWVKN